MKTGGSRRHSKERVTCVNTDGMEIFADSARCLEWLKRAESDESYSWRSIQRSDGDTKHNDCK